MGQAPGEGTLSKVFFDVSRVRRGVTLFWRQSELSSEEFYLRVGGRRNHIYGTWRNKEVGV